MYGSISIDNVEVAGDTKYVYISRPPIPTYCPNCSCRMHSEGIYKRKIKHPILQDSTCIIFIVSLISIWWWKAIKRKTVKLLISLILKPTVIIKPLRNLGKLYCSKKYRWVLLKNQDDINHSHRRYYHRSLGIYADTYMIEKMFLELDPRFPMILEAKREIYQFQ